MSWSKGSIQSEAISKGAVLEAPAPPPPPVLVCTSGTWSVPVSFDPCDTFRVTIDGPAADDVKVSATLEFEEP